MCRCGFGGRYVYFRPSHGSSEMLGRRRSGVLRSSEPQMPVERVRLPPPPEALRTCAKLLEFLGALPAFSGHPEKSLPKCTDLIL